MQPKRALRIRRYMDRTTIVMEDFRIVRYNGITEVWEKFKPARTIYEFCRKLENGDVIKKGDMQVFFDNNQVAWCIALSNVIAKRARLSPNPLMLKMHLRKVVKFITNTQLPF